MTELPAGAITEPHPEGNPALAAATEAILNRRLITTHCDACGDARRAAILLDALPDAAAALDAAVPHLAAEAAAAERKNVLGELLNRHGPVEDSSGWGSYCGVCWTRGDSRAAWPCPEAVAIADLLTGERS